MLSPAGAYVLAAAVVARPDPRWGETPCAFVELKAGAVTQPEDIVAHCRRHLAGFKVPRAVVFGELPKTSTGKIQKFELRRKAPGWASTCMAAGLRTRMRRSLAPRPPPRCQTSMADAEPARLRSSNFWILPVEVLGSSPNTTALGTL